ncbi:LacI family DNA-binding transcriptional regulator [Phyllobacterium endophyticum]|uniref:LacI family DNA-binding transcriptional regulator n=1 Tax=Phyllobacterium endophyticum TaxID=1149773 RepID=UPI0011C8815B|nr:LacI family DNA-binding transcriptional regulator [Phyllobacterium endophyticum]TXR48414.1 LacI family transcriptional regulator [Phyllobacterium endophyticum]
MARKRVTLQDLADALGVSKFSVSRALSGKPGVGKDTRRRIESAARDMGYPLTPEQAYNKGQIWFMRQEIDRVSTELWSNILLGAEQQAEAYGYTVVPKQAHSLFDGSLDEAVVGLILAVPYPDEISGTASGFNLPVVCSGYAGPLEHIDQVSGTDWEAGVTIARYLATLGHRKFAFVHGDARLLGRAERFRGLCDGAKEIGGTVDDLVFDEQAGLRKPLIEYMDAGGKPSALFCAHDGIAVSVISELALLGIRVPDDVSVVGFNDFISASQVAPSLTTIRTPHVEMGAAMSRCIIDRVSNPRFRTVPPLRINLVPELIIRESTGPASPVPWQRR